jgi:hypothetical protein
LNELSISGNFHWSAEVMIWDQIFTLRPNTSRKGYRSHWLNRFASSISNHD